LLLLGLILKRRITGGLLSGGESLSLGRCLSKAFAGWGGTGSFSVDSGVDGRYLYFDRGDVLDAFALSLESLLEAGTDVSSCGEGHVGTCGRTDGSIDLKGSARRMLTD